MRLDRNGESLIGNMLPSRAAERARSIRAWDGYAWRTMKRTDTIYLSIRDPDLTANWWFIQLHDEILLSLCMN